MSILLPSPRSSQPDYPVLVDYRNSIASGLIVSTAMTPAGAAYDSSRRGRNSNIITSANVTRKSGSSGTNLDFDGSQAEASVSFGNISFNQFIGLTIEVDFTVRSLASTATLVGKRTGSSCFFLCVSTGGRLQFTGFFAGGIFLTWQSADSTIVVNRQTHCIFSFLNRYGSMYINGSPVVLARNDAPTGTGLSLDDTNAAPLQLGRFTDGSPMTGSISLANVWGRGLSDAEAYSRYVNRWSLFTAPKGVMLSDFSGAAPSPTIYEFQSFSRGVGRGIARGIA